MQSDYDDTMCWMISSNITLSIANINLFGEYIVKPKTRHRFDMFIAIFISLEYW